MRQEKINIEFLDDDFEIERMNLVERVQHIVLMISFIILIFTGFPLLFYEWVFWRILFGAHILFYLRGLLHRISAVILIGLSIFHIFYVIFSKEGKFFLKAMIPKWKDVRDAFETFMHYFGFTSYLKKRGILVRFFERHPYWLFEELPKYERYDFRQKFEYWAVVWGSFVMILTGFAMWFVEKTISIFPLWVYDICRIIHSYEAILAFLAIIIWHMYNVHLNPEVFPMSKIWLTGKITIRELKVRHPLEYERLLNELRMREVAYGGDSEGNNSKN
ncbi:MAG: formate dehydrogenase subunit gamma [Candidatus Aminicenantia bacterium]